MQILCPVHNKPLEINESTIHWLGSDVRIWEGTCANCKVSYAGFAPLANFSSVIIGDKVYQYLPAMEAYREYQLKQFEAELERKEAEARRLFEEERLKKQAEKKAKAAQKKQRKDQKKAREAQRQKTLEEKEKNYKAQVLYYRKNPRAPFTPSSVVMLDTMPVRCKRDGKQLTHLYNVKGKKGYCCLYCNTHYLLKRTKDQAIPEKNGLQKIQKKPSVTSSNTQEHSPEIDFWKKLPKNPIELPDSDSVSVVRLTSGRYDIRYIGITNQKNEVNMSDGIYWHEHRFAGAVLQALLRQIPQMEYGELKLRLQEVKRGSVLSLYAKQDDVLRNTDPVPLYIYTLKLALEKYEVESATVQIYFPDAKKYVFLNAYYAKKQNRYYMNAETYNDSVSAYGLPYVKPYIVNKDGTINHFGSNLSMASELNLYGYNVSAQSNYSDTYRQSLLMKLICNQLMTKVQIMSHLEFLIHFHRHHIGYRDAVDKWEQDLRFIREYNKYGQRSVKGYVVPAMKKNRHW